MKVLKTHFSPASGVDNVTYIDLTDEDVTRFIKDLSRVAHLAYPNVENVEDTKAIDFVRLLVGKVKDA
jgi:hypothetical protein